MKEASDNLLFKWRWAVMKSSSLKPSTRHVLHVLGFMMDTAGDGCQVGAKKLCELTGMGRSTLFKALGEAEEEGWLDRIAGQADAGDRDANRYLPLIPGEVVQKSDGVVQKRDYPKQESRPSSPPPGGGGSPKTGLGVVQKRDGGSPESGPNLYRNSTGNSETTQKQTSSHPRDAGGRRRREDVEREDPDLKRWLPKARENIIRIHGGHEQPVRIEGQLVGVGIDVNRYKRLVKDHGEDPELVARAIRYIPDVTGLSPPVSVARWGADDGWAVYQQCKGRAILEAEREGVIPKIVRKTAGRISA